MKSEKTEKHFKRIDEQVSICDTIVEELLEYTRGRKVTPIIQDIAPLIVHTVDQITEQENVKILLDMDQNLPPIAHDTQTMRRVLINLFNNAIYAVNAQSKEWSDPDKDYSPEISLHVNKKENKMVLMVCDNGTGMNDETLRKAFEPLFTTKARGTGIGLANVKKIVTNHNGTIQMKSRPGKGTCISVILNYTLASKA